MLFLGSLRFYVHALNSEHAKYALSFYVNAYWLGIDWAWPLRDVLYACPLSWLILRSGMLNKTLSILWWRLYLPIFGLCVGLLTLIYIASFIVLAMPWSSLSIMLKFSGVVLSPVWVLCTWMGEGSFRCSLYLSPRVLDVSPHISHCTQVHHTSTSGWSYFSSPLGLCLWVWLTIPLWSYLSWNEFLSHICCTSS